MTYASCGENEDARKNFSGHYDVTIQWQKMPPAPNLPQQHCLMGTPIWGLGGGPNGLDTALTRVFPTFSHITAGPSASVPLGELSTSINVLLKTLASPHHS